MSDIRSTVRLPLVEASNDLQFRLAQELDILKQLPFKVNFDGMKLRFLTLFTVAFFALTSCSEYQKVLKEIT